MPNIRKAVWFSFFWEKQPQRHLCLPFQGKVINIRNQNANNKLMWVGEWGGILLSGLVTVANSYAPRHIYPLLPLMLINQVLSERQLDMQNSLLARKNKNWHSDFWCFFPRKGKTKLQFWYLALIISMERNRKCKFLFALILAKERHYFTKQNQFSICRQADQQCMHQNSNLYCSQTISYDTIIM